MIHENVHGGRLLEWHLDLARGLLLVMISSAVIRRRSPGTSDGQISFKLKAFHQFVGDSTTMRSKYGLTQLDPCIIYLT